MQSTKIIIWFAVFGVGTIVASAPQVSVPTSTAQTLITQEQVDNANPPTSPDLIVGLPAMESLMEEHDKSLDRACDIFDKELEQKAQAEGRKLREDEYIRVVKRVLLRPHPSSPNKDVLIDAYVLSNGATGRFLTTPVFKPEVRGPFQYRIEEMNLDEGWYIVRFLTAEELKAEQEQRPLQKPLEPLSFLDHVRGFLSPSQAFACPGAGPWTRSMLVEIKYIFGGALLVEEGVKLTWNNPNPFRANIPPVVISTAQKCVPQAPWFALGGCGSVTVSTVWTAYPVEPTKKASRSTIYKPVILGPDAAVVDDFVQGRFNGFWFSDGACTLSANLSGLVRCDETPDGF